MSNLILRNDILAFMTTNLRRDRSMARTLIRCIAMVTLLFTVVSCSQITFANCDPHSWHGLGVRDGVKGISPRAANEYERSCSHQSMAFDREAYEAGLEEGNAEYCAGQNGFDLGLSGVEVERVCVGKDAVAFNDGLEAGRKLRKAVLNLNQSTYPTKLDHGRYTIIPSSLNDEAFHENLDSRPAAEEGLRALRFPVMVKSGRVNGSNKRIRRSVNTADLVAKCEEAKSSAEERGFYTTFSCS